MIQIPLWRRGKVVGHTLVDEADAYLSQWHWYTDKSGYVRRTAHVPGRGKCCLFMHRLILGLERGDGLMADHINGDILDNRRCNLRVVTNQQNQQNRRGPRRTSTSGFRGVCKSSHGRWRAYLGNRYLGTRATPEEAAALAESARREAGYLEGAA